jgi:hypothetical protein
MNGAAYDHDILHPRIQPTGRYAAPVKPYVWRDWTRVSGNGELACQ